jgi:hypothetical protein
MALSVENDRHCFCCGPDNPHGLHPATAYPENGAAEASLLIDARYDGGGELAAEATARFLEG